MKSIKHNILSESRDEQKLLCLQQKTQELQAKRNAASKQIGMIKAQKKDATERDFGYR